jgi:hypothetical protein
MQNSGQGAIEYLLIIAAAILVVAIVILAVTGALGGGQGQVGTSTQTSFDSFLPLLIDAGSGTTEQLTISAAPTGSYKTLIDTISGNIYVNTDEFATTPEDLELAYKKGAVRIMINGLNAKDEGYTYTQGTPTAAKQIYLDYTASYDLIITFENSLTINSVEVTYIDYEKTEGGGEPTPTG